MAAKMEVNAGSKHRRSMWKSEDWYDEPFCKIAALESAAVVSGKMLRSVANPPLMLLTMPSR